MNYCSIKDCNRKRFGNGFCQQHNYRFKKYGDPLITVRIIDPLQGCKVVECREPHLSKGLCSKHYHKAKNYGDPLYSPANTRKEIFWNLVSLMANTDKCWEFNGRLNKDGYGVFPARSLGMKETLAHRVSFRLYFNENPGNLCVCHQCDNPKCVNPFHLFLGTNLENQIDKINKNRQTKGEGQGRSKLTENDVIEIKAEIAEGQKIMAIARKYNVTFGNISAIKRGKSWKHIQ